MTRHLHIDPFSGIAGDMFLGSLIDLGADVSAIQAALAKLPTNRPYSLQANRVQRHGIGAVDFKVHLTDHHDHDHQHHHTGYRQIMDMAELLDVSDVWKQRAARVVRLLAEAEARVHGKSIDEIHFHEVGAIDSIVDMLGSVIALFLLQIDTISCGPLPISRGLVPCEHGLMPVPTPATAYLLQDLPTIGVDRQGELVTPTGAALAAGLADAFGPSPAMTMRGIGYGAGDREDPDIPNLLRLLLGDRAPAESADPHMSSPAATH